jgi:hypothetical protein
MADDLMFATGETVHFRILVVDDAGDDLALAGYSIRWELQAPTPLVKNTADMVIAGNAFSITLTPEETEALLPARRTMSARYEHEAKIKSPTGVVSQVRKGTVLVSRSNITVAEMP